MAASGFTKVGNVLSSKGFENVSGIAGGLLTGLGASNDAAATRTANNTNSAREVLLRLLEARRGDARARAVAAADADPLGAENNFAARGALARQLVGGAQNVNIMPQDPAIAALMPTNTGGMRIPGGGLDMSAFSPEMIQEAIQRRRAAVSNISAAPQDQDEDELMGLLRQALDGDLSGAAQPKKQSGWKKFAKIAIPVAAAVAAPFTGGASLALLGAGAGAATGAIDGGWKGALIGGGLGAATAGIGAGAGGAASRTVGSLASRAATTAAPDLMQLALQRRQSGVRFGG